MRPVYEARKNFQTFIRNKKAAPVSRSGQMGAHHEGELTLRAPRRSGGTRSPRGDKLYFFFALGAAALRFSSIAACAAARRATGTRKGEQLT
ncbi:hypothetical protein LBMAG56_35860 [Verrucomicrobiota bacterium]|nr:hypothetical protein LBMAG56_35860 [Verrucomicrobiota bacterium]